MGYTIKMAEVDAAYDSYVAYGDPILGTLTLALEKLREAVRELTVMESFKGQTAEVVKSYFGDAYPLLIDHIECLAAQLKSDYAVRYMDRYANQPIAEGAAAVLPEDELESKRGLLAFAKDSRVPSIQQNLSRARSALPDGIALAFPSPVRLQAAFNAVHGEVEQLKNSVGALEEEGSRLFGSEPGQWGLFALRLKNAIQCKCVMDMVTYEPGQFFTHMETIVSRQSFEESTAHQQEDQQGLVAAERAWIDRQLLREEEAYRMCEEGRSQWELVGLGATAALLLVGAFAVVTAGAPVAALVAGAGALKTGADLMGRIQDKASDSRSASNEEWEGKGVSVEEAAVAMGIKAATKVGGKLSTGPSIPGKVLVSKQVRGTASLVDAASSGVQIVADYNHDKMRLEAQAHLKKAEELRSRRAVLQAA